jgi:hypothetical protein
MSKNYKFDEWINHENTEITIKKATPEHPHDATVRRIKDTCLFIFAMATMISAFSYCGWQVAVNNNQGWPLAIDSSIISALLGYLVGKKSS